jgi:opacity protein-like surface antigen
MTSRNITLAALSGAALLSFGVTTQAAEPQIGVYVGGGITQSRFDDDQFSVTDVDDEDSSWKAIAGFRAHRNFAFEANYVNFGKASEAAPGSSFADAEGFALYGVGVLPVGPVELFAKAGGARLKSKYDFGTPADDNSTKFAYGGGVQFRLGPVSLRGEYEQYETDTIGNIKLITVGATYTFGAR